MVPGILGVIPEFVLQNCLHPRIYMALGDERSPYLKSL